MATDQPGETYNPDFIEAVRLACLACFARVENNAQPIMFGHLQDAWDMMTNGEHLRRDQPIASPAPTGEATIGADSRDGWIGVDFDGTLAHYAGFRGLDHLGEPVPAMLERVKAWIADGRDVRIFTARGCRGGDEQAFAYAAISEWCKRHLGRALPITRTKDMHMHELWDDRAVQVVKNTGRRADTPPAAPAAVTDDDVQRALDAWHESDASEDQDRAAMRLVLTRFAARLAADASSATKDGG